MNAQIGRGMRTPVLHLGEKRQGQGSGPQSRQESGVRLKVGGKFGKFLINIRAAHSVLTEPLRSVHASHQMTVQATTGDHRGPQRTTGY